ncbi:ribosome maturation protein [Hyaloraphidium curvatum]|nr:ribosome maturation protein [Hyaloraphidium curvatum]
MAEHVVYTPKQTEGKEGELPLFEVITNSGMAAKWRKDKSVPLVDVVQRFDVYEHRAGGAEGVGQRPSKAVLEEFFGTSNTTDVIEFILTNGEIQPMHHHKSATAKREDRCRRRSRA